MFRNETDQTVPYQVGDEVVMVQPGGEVADPVVIPPYQPPAPVLESVTTAPEATPVFESVTDAPEAAPEPETVTPSSSEEDK